MGFIEFQDKYNIICRVNRKKLAYTEKRLTLNLENMGTNTDNTIQYISLRQKKISWIKTILYKYKYGQYNIIHFFRQEKFSWNTTILYYPYSYPYFLDSMLISFPCIEILGNDIRQYVNILRKLFGWNNKTFYCSPTNKTFLFS